MSLYAIGDIQGCFGELQQLLQKISFDATHDRLWFVGDLINRGPNSLETLRFVKLLGDSAVTVLGNHDLHLLAVAAGYAKLKGSDTLQPILDAPDREELIDWLRQRPMLHREGEYVMVHAGLLPQWTVEQATELAREVETVLRGAESDALLSNMYGNTPDHWSDNLQGWDRLRVIINAMTRMRFCNHLGVMEFKNKGKPADALPGFMPWFEVPNRQWKNATLLCGHWSAVGLEIRPNLLSLDSGCLWGGELTAVRLPDRQVTQISCPQPAKTKSGK